MKKHTSHPFGDVCGIATVGERGQIVIPKEARTKLKLKQKDRFLIIEHFGKLIFIPEKMMRRMMKQVTQHLT